MNEGSVPAAQVDDGKGFLVFIVAEFGVLLAHVDIVQVHLALGKFANDSARVRYDE